MFIYLLISYRLRRRTFSSSLRLYYHPSHLHHQGMCYLLIKTDHVDFQCWFLMFSAVHHSLSSFRSALLYLAGSFIFHLLHFIAFFPEIFSFRMKACLLHPLLLCSLGCHICKVIHPSRPDHFLLLFASHLPVCIVFSYLNHSHVWISLPDNKYF